jgi:ATP-binding cassette, subfamily B, bacterial PglK
MPEKLADLMTRLWRHISAHRKRQMSVLIVLMLVSAFMEIASIGAVIPFLSVLTAPDVIFANEMMRPLISAFGINDPSQLALLLTIAFAGIALLSGLVRLAFLWYQTRLSHAIGADLSVEIYRRTLFQPYAVHISRNSSEVIAGISAKANGVTNGVILPSLTMASSVVTSAAIIATIAYVQPVVALVSFVFLGGTYLGITLFVRRQLDRTSRNINKGMNSVIRALQEGLGGIRDVLMDGAQSEYVEAYRGADYKLRRATANAQIIGGAPRFLVEAVGMVLIAGLAYAYFTSTGGMAAAIPILGALAIGAQRLLPLAQQIYSSLAFFKAGKAPLIDVLELLDQPLPDYHLHGYADPLTFENSIELRRISFQYGSGGVPVLRGLELTIPQGARVGFIGRTGSGKTTLLDIVMGLLSPSEGELLVDGVKVETSNLRRWQSSVAHVPQSIFLSDASIAENIAFGKMREDLDMARIREAATAAQLKTTIEAMDKGYETEVGERGVRLSGGQRQRIGIARALYKNARLLVLDEATSALDNETERAVMETLYGLRDNLTVLMVAHRLSTLASCDFIVELRDGTVSRIGTYAEIIGSRADQ